MPELASPVMPHQAHSGTCVTNRYSFSVLWIRRPQVHWVGLGASRYKFYRWVLNPKSAAVFGESIVTRCVPPRSSA